MSRARAGFILHDEVKNFPLQHWLRSTVIAIGSLLVLFMLLFWIPLDMPIKFTLSWMKGAQTIEATTVKQLEKLACGWAIRCT